MIPLSIRTQSYLTILLGVLLSITLLFALLQWHDDWVFIQEKPMHPPVRVAHDNTQNLIAAIPNTHLFGNSIKQLGAVPATNLNLIVTGIVQATRGNDKSFSKAYISAEGEPSRIYRVGEKLPSGVKVLDITADTVILDHDGQLEKLPLPRNPLTFKSFKRNN